MACPGRRRQLRFGKTGLSPHLSGTWSSDRLIADEDGRRWLTDLGREWLRDH